MKALKKYGFYVLFAFAMVMGVGLAHISYEAIVEPNSPYILADMDVPSTCSPVGYEPVEFTGKPPEEGKRLMITCTAPAVYEPYIHYPKGWESNILNPANPWGQAVKWILYGVLAILLGLLAWRIVRIIRKKRKQGG